MRYTLWTKICATILVVAAPLMPLTVVSGCDKPESSSASAKSASPAKEATADSKISLPEFYGSYAIDRGQTVALKNHKKYEGSTTRMYQPDELKEMPDLGSVSEFIFYDRSVKGGGDAPTLRRGEK